MSERMPDADVPVLAFVVGEHNKKWTRRIRAMWAPKHTVTSGSEDEISEYNEAEDEYYLPEGWYERNEYDECAWRVHDPVTHWMPLPAPPNASAVSGVGRGCTCGTFTTVHDVACPLRGE